MNDNRWWDRAFALLMLCTMWLVGMLIFHALSIGPALAQGGPPQMGAGGFPGRMPVVMGTIVEIDRDKGLIYVESFGGEQTVKVTASTKAVTQTTSTVSALKVGDRLQVQGMPTGLRASSVTIGEMPDFLRMGPPGGPGAAAGGGGQRASAPRAGPPAAFGSATGTVTALNPLTISVSKDVSVVLKLAPDAKITKITPVLFAGIKEQDRVMAIGQHGDDGVFVATGLGVNLAMGGPFMGAMPGMGFGGPGRGNSGAGQGARPPQ